MEKLYDSKGSTYRLKALANLLPDKVRLMAPVVCSGEESLKHLRVLAIGAEIYESPVCFFNYEAVGVEGRLFKKNFQKTFQVGLQTTLKRAYHIS
jgi:hypothetical protein